MRTRRRRATYTAKKVRVDKRPFSSGYLDAFGHADAVAIRKPQKWDLKGADVPWTRARVLYDEKRLYFAFEMECGTFKKNANIKPYDGGKWAEANDVPKKMRRLLQDDRVEAFVWPVGLEDGESDDLSKQTYYAFEVTRSGAAVTSATRFYRKFDFSHSLSVDGMKFHEGISVYSDSPKIDVFVFSVKLRETIPEVDVRKIRIGLHRGTRIDDKDGTFSWGSWIEPGDSTVDFHRPEMFGDLRFE